MCMYQRFIAIAKVTNIERGTTMTVVWRLYKQEYKCDQIKGNGILQHFVIVVENVYLHMLKRLGSLGTRKVSQLNYKTK